MMLRMRRVWCPPLALLIGACGFTASTNAPADGPPGGGDARTIDAAVVADARPADAAIDAPPGCTDTDVTASKSYIPSVTTDGTLTVTAMYPKLVVPGALSVVFGNAGNQCAQLVFKRSSNNQTVRCRYRGGADVAHVGLNPFQISKGLRYVFDTCTQGAACPSSNGTPEDVAVGEQIPVTELITLHVDNGDDFAGPTVITQPIRMCQ